MSSKKKLAAEACQQDYTVWCRASDGRGTTWIGLVEAASQSEAAERGRQSCMVDWEQDDPTKVHVTGIAKGDVEILEWDDEACVLTGEPGGVL